jgi:hypothetical protein
MSRALFVGGTALYPHPTKSSTLAEMTIPMSRSYTVTMRPYPNVIWNAVLVSRQSSYTMLWKLL